MISESNKIGSCQTFKRAEKRKLHEEKNKLLVTKTTQPVFVFNFVMHSLTNIGKYLTNNINLNQIVNKDESIDTHYCYVIKDEYLYYLFSLWLFAKSNKFNSDKAS